MKKITSVLPKIKQQSSLSKRARQIVNLAGELIEKPFDLSKDLSFMSRLLVMVNLPYKDPGKEALGWWRKNGQVVLDITPGRSKGKSFGIPYGSYPRLILAYLITQAVKTQSPIINLGNTFREFLDLLGIEKGGHQYRQLKKQLDRIFTAAFSWSYSNEKQQMWSRTNIQVSHKSQLWWDPKSPDQLSFLNSYVELNANFFNEIIRNPVPIDFRVLKVLKNSPLGLDLYMFLAWRTFNLKEPVFISWQSLHDQLGGQYTDLKNFAREAKKHLKRIQAIWPELSITSVRGRLCMNPSRSLVPAVEKS
jgi:hypothetical protein